MPRTKEEQKEYDRQYYLKNKEKRAEQNKEWVEANRERHKAYHKQWNIENREKETERVRKSRATPKGKKSHYKSWWKCKLGMIWDDFDELWERHQSATCCELCYRSFDTCKKVLDHDHRSRYARNVCCNGCNQKLAVRDRQLAEVHLELHRYFIYHSI
jgi:hypothetical protein